VKLIFGICLALALSGIARGHAVDDPEVVVRQIINTGLIQGWDRKVLLHLGDAGAVLLTKVLADKELTSKTIGSVLIVIEESFADPSFVEIARDRRPRTALLVLRYLELSTNDADLKKHIADTGKHVRDRYAASLKEGKQ
jgi:hypothetical protein